jgi:mono/diheme cytochrome c family protein
MTTLAAGLLLAALGLGLTVYAADSGQEEWKAPAYKARRKNPIPADDQSVAAGKALYVKNCLSCHGTLGKGDGPAAKDLDKQPGDLSSAKTREQSDGALFWKITQGRKPMPTFEKLLSEEERWHVINYARTFATPPATQKSN